MKIEITGINVKEDGNRLYLEIQLNQLVDFDWEQSYYEALKQQSITLFFSGAPSVEDVTFYGDRIMTKEFPAYAQNDLPKFIEELKVCIKKADAIYESRMVLRKQQEELRKQTERERQKELDDLSKTLNDLL